MPWKVWAVTQWYYTSPQVGLRVRGAWYRAQGTWYMVQGAWYRAQGTGYMVQGSGYSGRYIKATPGFGQLWSFSWSEPALRGPAGSRTYWLTVTGLTAGSRTYWLSWPAGSRTSWLTADCSELGTNRLFGHLVPLLFGTV